MSESDRLRERAHQIDMAQNGFSLPWAKKHLSPLLRESADRIAALEELVMDMYNCGSCDRDECKFYKRMKELGVM